MESQLGSWELRLLRCTLGGPANLEPPPLSPLSTHNSHLAALHRAIEIVVRCVEEGAYFDALSAEPASLLLWLSPTWKERLQVNTTDGGDPGQFYKALAGCVSAFLDIEDGSTQHAASGRSIEREELRSRAMLVMAVGVAALLAFMQANWTGPPLNLPPCPLSTVCKKDGNLPQNTWNFWANEELMVDGCDLLGMCALPQFLIFSKILLVDAKENIRKNCFNNAFGLETWNWWGCRTLSAHQHVLAERSPSLYTALTHANAEITEQFGSTKSVLRRQWDLKMDNQEASTIATLVQLEAGLVEYTYGHIDKARQYFKRAEQACGIQFSITGALGFRTIHQVDPKPQMILVANSTSTSSNLAASKEESLYLDVSQSIKSVSLQGQKEVFEISTESDILLAPNLVEDMHDVGIPATARSGDCGKNNYLNTVQQAVVLAQCLEIKKSNPDDDLKGWQMAPYIEAVDAQQDSHFMVKYFCQLLRIHWECARSRTQQRALLLMEHLVEAIQGSSFKVTERMCFVFCVGCPTIPALLKEHAELMVSCGLVREALLLFEKLELWDNLIDCYCLLEKKSAAVNLIQQRLQIQPNDPRLWCSLGDVTLDDECYIKAWEFSAHRFARAQRSLGRSAYNRAEYNKSMKHWTAALALNPLHPGGWFALGSAALKAREMDKAIDAFTRAVQLDPYNGESWNNIAAIHMTKKRSKEAFIAFREALKFRRNTWQMWENFAQVALDIGNFGQAIEALQMVLDLSQGKHVDLVSLTRLVEEVEARKVSSVGSKDHVYASSDKKGVDECTTSTSVSSLVGDEITYSHEDIGKRQSKEAEWLQEVVGKLLAQIAHSCECGGEIWGLLARWHRVKGDLTMCTEALLKQVRANQSSDVQRSSEQFQKFAQVSVQLCEVYIETASMNRSKRELHTARMHLRNTIKQGQCFTDTDGYKALESCLKKVENALQYM